MAEEISLNFYKVDQCGHFQRGNDLPLFGDLSSTLDNVYEWINSDGPAIGSTKTFIFDEESSFLPVYCYDIKKNTDSDYLLITWNETETAEGAFASIRANQQAGSAQVITTSFPNNSIPGHPSYFWFIPERNLFATIRFGGRLSGNPGMNKFMQGFLERFSQWVQVEDGEERSLDTEILGYAENDEGELLHHVKARFKTSLVRKQGEIEYIRQNRERIRKIIRKDEYTSNVEVKRSLFQAIFNHLGITDYTDQNQNTARFKYELNITPSRNDLEQIITNWQTRHDESWDDVGFEFEGEAGVKWLGSSLVKNTFEVNVRWNETRSVVNPNSLLRALAEKKVELLQLIDEDRN